VCSLSYDRQNCMQPFSEISFPNLSLPFLPFPVLCNFTVRASVSNLSKPRALQLAPRPPPAHKSSSSSPLYLHGHGSAFIHSSIRFDTALYSPQQDPILISALRNLHHPTKEVTPPQNLPAGCSQSVLNVAAHLYSPYWRNPTSRSSFLHLVPCPLRSV